MLGSIILKVEKLKGKIVNLNRTFYITHISNTAK